MENRSGVRIRRNAEQIKIILADFANSGKDARSFSASIGVTATTFSKWRSRYSESATTDSSDFVILKQISDPVRSNLFAEVNSIRLYQPVSAQFLKELIS